MYERFTDRARKVMQLANQETQIRNEEKVCTHHLLLALLKEGLGLAAHVLKNFNLTLKMLRDETEKHVPCGPDIITMGKMPVSPRLRTVVTESMNEAAKLSHSYVGTEHLLLGLMVGENIAVSIMLGLGIDPAMVRAEVMCLCGRIEEVATNLVTKADEDKEKRLAFLETMRCLENRVDQIELLAAAFAKQTGLDPTQCQLVEQRHADGRRTWHFEPKAPPAVGALGIVQPTGNDEVCCHYDETDVRAMGLSVNDVVGDHVVLRNDRPTPNTKGRLVLLHRPLRVFHYPENPAHPDVVTATREMMGKFGAAIIGGTIGSNPVPMVHNPLIMQLQKHAEEHFSGDVALSQSLPDAAMCDCGEGDGGHAPLPHMTWCRTNQCRCKSLLNGHEAGCPMA